MTTRHVTPVNRPDLVIDDGRPQKHTRVRKVEFFFDDTVNTDPYNAEREAAPLGWVNSASIELDAEADTITFTISVTDPRGAFTVNVHRLRDGSLYLMTPHPSDPLLHAPLREERPGVYEIGSFGHQEV